MTVNGFPNRIQLDRKLIEKIGVRATCEERSDKTHAWRLDSTPNVIDKNFGTRSAHDAVAAKAVVGELVEALSAGFPILCERALPAKELARAGLDVTVKLSIEESFASEKTPIEKLGKWRISVAPSHQAQMLSGDRSGWNPFIERMIEARNLLSILTDDELVTRNGTSPLHEVQMLSKAWIGIQTRAENWEEAVVRATGTQAVIDALLLGKKRTATKIIVGDVSVAIENYHRKRADELVAETLRRQAERRKS